MFSPHSTCSANSVILKNVLQRSVSGSPTGKSGQKGPNTKVGLFIKNIQPLLKKFKKLPQSCVYSYGQSYSDKSGLPPNKHKNTTMNEKWEQPSSITVMI
ncbi:hypothetical protein ATANTOWER_023148 [Ataeniobius toweri]|uniref:Uncharacterized protein n=1 Tax=Ataeniobius toweri TaxID=208326 RepID=A0ABU7AT36_9TELE|nr:hypothetical protein [Ataeniobius toweri]